MAIMQPIWLYCLQNRWNEIQQLLFYHDDPFNTAVDLCGRDGSAYTVLRLQVYTEELLQFLQNCKGSVNFKWVLRMVFGTRYDEKLKNAAFRTLFRTGKIQLASDQKK